MSLRNNNSRNHVYSEYSRTCSRFSDQQLNVKKLLETDYTTRAARRSGWDLYKKVYCDWGRYFEDGSTHRAAYECGQIFPDTARSTFTRIEERELAGLIETVLRDPNVVNFTMRIDGVPELRQQVVECIVYTDLSTDIRYVEDRKRRVEDRCVRIVENIVDVRDYERDYYLVTTQNTRPKRPYLYGRFEKIFGEFADEEIADTEFRICYKIPKAALSDVYVFNSQMHRFHVI